MKLKVFAQKGFSITFENKLTISVMFGAGNYCEKRNDTPAFRAPYKFEHESTSAEIAIWDEKDTWFNFGSDQVKGWVSSDEVAKWITKVQKAKTLKSIRK